MLNTINKTIIRSKRRTLCLQIASDVSLIIRAPERMSLGTIEDFVRKKLPWINRKQRFMRENFIPPVQKEFAHGEEFMYLGQAHQLFISDELKLKQLLFTGKEFFLFRRHLPKAREKFVSWYRKQALEILSRRVAYYEGQTGLKHSRIKITSARKRWGSCNSKGVLSFTWRLMLTPIEVIDYVVVHELTHIAEHNHSKKFWDRVSAILPQYQEAEKWLKVNHNLLEL